MTRRFCRSGCVLLAFTSSLLLISCATPSPRFRAPDDRPKPETPADDEVTLAPRIKEEETREDDKKVDLSQVQNKLTSLDTASAVPRDRVLLDVVSFLGTPYAYGRASKEGTDCSGFTANIFATALNKKLPRSTKEQYEVGAEIPRTDLRFGDLVFFNTTGRTPSHVGIYIEDDLFAHASVSYGVTISSLESSYYKKRFVGGRRVTQ